MRISRTIGIVAMTVALAGCDARDHAAAGSDGLHVAGGSSAGFQQAYQQCAQQFADAGLFNAAPPPLGGTLLGDVRAEPVTIIDNSGHGSGTDSHAGAGAPQTVYWDPSATGSRSCSGAPVDPCAALAHELKHAKDQYEVTPPPEQLEDEHNAVRVENFFLSARGECQRDSYEWFGSCEDMTDALWPVAGGCEVRSPPAIPALDPLDGGSGVARTCRLARKADVLLPVQQKVLDADHLINDELWAPSLTQDATQEARIAADLGDPEVASCVPLCAQHYDDAHADAQLAYQSQQAKDLQAENAAIASGDQALEAGRACLNAWTSAP